MAQNPQDWARKLQQSIQQQRSGKGGFGGGFGGGRPPKGSVGAIGGLIILAGGYLVVNNALFNGKNA